MKDSGRKKVELFESTTGNSLCTCTHFNALATINMFHWNIHAGQAFTAYHLKEGIAASGTFDILIAVPSATYPHFRWNTQATAGPGLLNIYEGTTTSADGTGISSFNASRSSANTAGSVITHTPTVTDAGTLIKPCYVSGTKKEAGSSADLLEEVIFKPSTKYLFRYTNNDGADVDVAFEFAWYEGES